MRGRTFWAGLGLALMVLAPAGARAADRGDDWYRDVRPWVGPYGEGEARRASLIDQDVRLRSEVRRAERRGDLSGREADRLYDRLDHVAKFLRDDRHLTGKEYNRRRDDLDKVAADLRRASGERYGRRPGNYR
jgi:hypothetical protein